MKRSNFQAGFDFLDSASLSRGRVSYFDSATRKRWMVSRPAVTALGRMLSAGTPDAYSIWCGQTTAREVNGK